jgi:16S rRNA processing protein RimM
VQEQKNDLFINRLSTISIMISANEIFPIGQINKPHGVNGEMSFNFTSDVFDTEEVPFFILSIQGIFVPFFIESYRFNTDITGLIKFDGINTEEQAREFIGLTIYLENKYLNQVENTEIELDYFVGFSMTDAQKGLLGVIAEVDQSTENVLFVIPTDDDELLIPFVEEFIEEIDHKKKMLFVNLPAGLLDL